MFVFFKRKIWIPYLVSLLGLYLVACPPQSILSKLVEPKGTTRQKVRWFRSVFYKLCLVERQKKDSEDRLRRLCRHFPKLSQASYKENKKAIRLRRQEGLKLRPLEKFYLMMNLIIKASIPLPSSLRSVLGNPRK